jgi:hypothetical protein
VIYCVLSEEYHGFTINQEGVKDKMGQGVEAQGYG